MQDRNIWATPLCIVKRKNQRHISLSYNILLLLVLLSLINSFLSYIEENTFRYMYFLYQINKNRRDESKMGREVSEIRESEIVRMTDT